MELRARWCFSPQSCYDPIAGESYRDAVFLLIVSTSFSALKTVVSAKTTLNISLWYACISFRNKC